MDIGKRDELALCAIELNDSQPQYCNMDMRTHNRVFIGSGGVK